MTKKNHIEKFGHAKYHNKVAIFPDGVKLIGSLCAGEHLSKGTPEEIAQVEYISKIVKYILKPCPFCTGEAGFTPGDRSPAIVCKDCNAKIEDRGSVMSEAKVRLINKWNNRKNKGGENDRAN